MSITLEDILPLSLIRQHTKTDDTPSVTDELLSFYRKAAFDTAEKYTARTWTEIRHVQQDIPNLNQQGIGRRRNTITVVLDYPTTDGKLTLYGGALAAPRDVKVAPGSTRVTLRAEWDYIPMNDCCAPNRCSQYGLRVSYVTGVFSKEDVPPGILLGVLRFIAWNIENAGDQLMTVRGKEGFSGQLIDGTNNGAWASGAIEQWRMFKT